MITKNKLFSDNIKRVSRLHFTKRFEITVLELWENFHESMYVVNHLKNVETALNLHKQNSTVDILNPKLSNITEF